MLRTPSFNVYNASAGSGKTYTLVKAYLKLLLQSKRSDLFKNILALTFTNKAVGEMKTRVIQTLKEFSDESILLRPNSMFKAIEKELEIKPEHIQHTSKIILETILHNYAAFDISTIDRFTHKVIRTFAFDLKIPVNFEVELDTESLLAEAVDNLISKAGTDKALTKILVDFAIEKADDDKSWDVSYDLNKISKLLVNENEAPFLNLLKDKTLEDFKNLKGILRSKVSVSQSELVESAQSALTLIAESGLEFDDFSGRNGYVPSYFAKLVNKDLNLSYDKVWMTNIETHPLYPKATDASVSIIIDEIQPQIARLFNETKRLVYEIRFYKNIFKNLTPLSVLNAIQKELTQLKTDKNILLISEFNDIINSEIKNQPTPFIYERLGEKFKHYFIDEFQDTSEMQWGNLIPLIDNRISSEEGSAMIVGDAKQAIYRWRGGKPEMFIDLVGDAEPFNVKKQLHNLPVNYRSCKRIVEFNNAFFKHLASFAFANNKHKTLYISAQQESHIETEGFVNMEFLDLKNGDRDALYPEAVKQTIERSLINGFQLSDICVLVRKKKEGVAIADYLTAQDINIISSETLLINRSPKVRFVANTLKLATQPDDLELRANVYYFVAELLGVNNKHVFLSSALDANFEELLEQLQNHNIHFNLAHILQLSLYDAAEYVIRAFNLVNKSDAYIQFYLDTVLDYSLKQSSSINDFLVYWEKKKEVLSITIPDGKNAVQIMTIHKSKGLEFPVVIFPYADLNIYREKEPKIWFPLEDEGFNNFSYALLNYNKDISEMGSVGELLYQQHQSSLELDNINLLYVTLTRAVEQLHIISNKNLDSKGNEKLTDYSGLFINYLKETGTWSDSKTSYANGQPKRQLEHASRAVSTTSTSTFISNNNSINIVTSSGNLWDTEQGQAIEKGNLMHYLLSKILSATDLDFVLDDALLEGIITADQKPYFETTIQSILNHPKLVSYYSSKVRVYNERDIITPSGVIVRPDRLVLTLQQEAVLIDYKTGAFDKKHEQQLVTYADIIESMEIPVIKKILIYINKDINIKEV